MKIHEKVDDVPVDITGVVTCHWCESKEAKCIQTVGLFAFCGLCIGLGILALMYGELYFCVMLLFVGSMPVLFLLLFFIYVKVKKAKHSSGNSIKITENGEENVTDILIVNENPYSCQGRGLEVQSQFHRSGTTPANDPPPEYDEAIRISCPNGIILNTNRNSSQTTTV